MPDYAPFTHGRIQYIDLPQDIEDIDIAQQYIPPAYGTDAELVAYPELAAYQRRICSALGVPLEVLEDSMKKPKLLTRFQILKQKP